MQMKEELLIKDKVTAICGQWIGWTLDEVVDPNGEFHFDGKT